MIKRRADTIRTVIDGLTVCIGCGQLETARKSTVQLHLGALVAGADADDGGGAGLSAKRLIQPESDSDLDLDLQRADSTEELRAPDLLDSDATMRLPVSASSPHEGPAS